MININIVDKNKYFDYKDEMVNFIRENEKKYRSIDLNLEFYIAMDFCLGLSAEEIPNFLSQILSRFNVYKEGYDEYIEMANLLEKYSLLNGNCCEIGAGIYPRLAELVAPKIRLNGGSLTVYDPKTIFTELKNMKVVKEVFTRKNNIDEFDTIYGLYPCEASKIMIKKAFKEDKNLMIAFCDCIHYKNRFNFWDKRNWIDKICDKYVKKYGSDVELINWPSHMEYKLPIMIRKSNKLKEKKISTYHM